MTDEILEQQSLAKQQFLATFFSKFSDIQKFVDTLPIHLHLKQNAITRFDEGMFWVREGIMHLQTIAPVGEPAPLE